MSKFFNLSIVATITTLTLGFSGFAKALTVIPDDLNPGDQYRLVFLTDNNLFATSSNIDDYNQFVTLDVIGSTLETELTIAGLTPNWSVIGSTATVSARDNTETQGSEGVPIYRLTGERVANDYEDLWNGDILAPILTTPDGNEIETLVWAGTVQDGTIGVSPLGGDASGFTTFGVSSFTTFRWINSAGNVGANFELSLYGMSSVLTVPQEEPESVPEPSSILGFITLGGLMLGEAVRRKKK